MKKDIHPDYFKNATISCACGASYTVGSTVEAMQVELCAQCHPFYTGTQKIIDTARRVEKFEARAQKKDQDAASSKKAKLKKRAEKKAEKQLKKIEKNTIRPSK